MGCEHHKENPRRKAGIVRLKYWGGLLLSVYIAFVYWLTVFSRGVSNHAGCEWGLFWTYKAILFDGKEYLIGEVINNVLLFFPIGVLIALLTKKLKWTTVLFVCVPLSFCIEVLQFYLKRGLCETDDIFHNTLGCLIGFVIVRGLQKRSLERNDTLSI
jgi:glycopeptide antibiotics resistance protein